MVPKKKKILIIITPLSLKKKYLSYTRTVNKRQYKSLNKAVPTLPTINRNYLLSRASFIAKKYLRKFWNL